MNVLVFSNPLRLKNVCKEGYVRVRAHALGVWRNTSYPLELKLKVVIERTIILVRVLESHRTYGMPLYSKGIYCDDLLSIS